MNLDAGYDFQEVHDALFNFYYIPKVVKNPRRSKKAVKKIPDGYRRWFIERSHSWLNKFRRLYVRYEKYSANYLALLHFAFSIITFKKLTI
jgi:transposase